MYPRGWVSFFHPTAPAVAAATISKIPLKPLPPPLSRNTRAANPDRLERSSHAVPDALLPVAAGSSVDRHDVEHRSLPPSPPWAGRGGECRSGSQAWRKASEGGSRCARIGGAPFSAHHPPPGICEEFLESPKTPRHFHPPPLPTP